MIKKKKMSKWIKLLVFTVCALVVYSFLPLIPFWFMKGAPKGDNNEASVEVVKNNTGDYFSFIVFGDNHSGLVFNDAAALKEIWSMNREDRFRKVPIDFVLNVGDVTLNGGRWQFEFYKKLQKLIKWPLISAIGNHDGKELFKEYCGKSEFSFVDRNSLFIVLDNSDGGITEAQFKWFEDELRKSKRYDHRFVIAHKPPFDPYQQDWYNADNIPWAYHFRKLCAQYNVDMVFSGHKHMYKHGVFDGVSYIVTGGGGMLIEIPEDDGGYLNYVRVMVNNDYVTYEVRKISPPLWSYLVYYFWKELVYKVRDFYGSGYILGRNTRQEPLRVQDLNAPEYWGDRN